VTSRILTHVRPFPGLDLPPHLPNFRGTVGMRCRDAKRLPDRTVVIQSRGTVSSREDGECVAGGGISERSDEVEELAAVCESSGGTAAVVCGESKSISPSEPTGELAARKDEVLVTDDASSDKISTSSSPSEPRSSSELTSEGLDVRGAVSRPRGEMYEGKGVLRR
jgi:hypothetical protein